jgi:hypothetical protein
VPSRARVLFLQNARHDAGGDGQQTGQCCPGYAGTLWCTRAPYIVQPIGACPTAYTHNVTVHMGNVRDGIACAARAVRISLPRVLARIG